MDQCAFISLEGISDALPPYREEVVPVTMDKRLREAYDALEEEIRKCLKEHRGNSSVVSTMLNALLSWPDHPYGSGRCTDRNLIRRRVAGSGSSSQRRWTSTRTRSMQKKRALIEEVKAQLARGRKCQVFAVYTHKHDVNARLEHLCGNARPENRPRMPSFRKINGKLGIGNNCDDALTRGSAIPRLLRRVLISSIFRQFCSMKPVTRCMLRQASRRSWRIGQRRPLEVKFFASCRKCVCDSWARNYLSPWPWRGVCLRGPAGDLTATTTSSPPWRENWCRIKLAVSPQFGVEKFGGSAPA
jgi:hypothetical protein